MTIDALVIGAGGQDGFYLVIELLSAGKSVVAVYRNPESSLAAQDEFLKLGALKSGHLVCVDAFLETSTICQTLVTLYEPAVIFQLAGVNLPSVSTQGADLGVKELMFNAHCLITENFLQILKGRSDTRIIVALSSKMFAKPIDKDIRISSHSKPSPSDHYGITKSLAWDLIKRYREEGAVKANGVILFNHDSPRRRAGFLVPHLVEQFRRALSGEQFHFEIQGWGHRADWSDSREIVQALSLLMRTPFDTDFSIGAGSGTSVHQISLEVIRLLGLNQESFCEDYAIPKSVSFEPALIADLSEIGTLLPWAPKRTIASLIIEQL